MFFQGNVSGTDTTGGWLWSQNLIWIKVCTDGQVLTAPGAKWGSAFVQPNQWRIQDFPEEGALTPKGGRQPVIWPIFPENCMRMKKFWAGGGRASLAPPLDPPLETAYGGSIWIWS